MEMLTIKLLLLLMITKQHIVKSIFSLLPMGKLERLLFKSGIMDPVTTTLFYISYFIRVSLQEE